jgi:hypothetical protein
MLNKMQYFISGLSNSGPVNKVAEALANRIIRAVKEQQPFKVPSPPPPHSIHPQPTRRRRAHAERNRNRNRNQNRN